MKDIGNKILREKFEREDYVIIADRDGVRKYVGRKFPYSELYTIKLNLARKFNSYENARRFIEENKRCKVSLYNPKIHKIM